MDEKTLQRINEGTEIAERAAMEIIEAERLQNEIKQAEAAKAAAEEKEKLKEEALKLTGRAEAFNLISEFSTVSNLLTIKKIKESKIYMQIPGVETWEKYCKYVGFSRAKLDLDLDNLKVFGEKFIANVSNFGLGYRELRQLKSQVKSGNLEIKQEDNTVVIEGEVVSLDDKDELKEALEGLIAQQNKKLKEKDNEIKRKNDELAEKDKALNGKNTTNAAQAVTIKTLSDKLNEAEEAVKAKSEELRKAKTIEPAVFNDGTHIKNDPIYQGLLRLQGEVDSIIGSLMCVARRNDLSEFHQNIFGGLFMHFFKRLDDIRCELATKDNCHYYDNFYLTEADKLMAENMWTPSKYMHEIYQEEDDNK